jgi:copper chaperone
MGRNAIIFAIISVSTPNLLKNMTLELQVPTIACVGCISTISMAIATLDPNAKIQGNATAKTITVETTLAESVVRQAITQSGHTVA